MPRTKHTRLLAVATAAALVATACGGGSQTLDEATVTTKADDAAVAEQVLGPEETTTTELVVEPEDATATETPAAAEIELGSPAALGRYRTDLLGTEIEVELDRGWTPVAGDPGALIVSYADKRSEFGEALLFTRMSSFASAEDFDDPSPAGQFLGGPADDFDAWLDASGELIVDSDQQVELGGTMAREVQVRLDPEGTSSFPGGCGPGPDDRCFFVGGTQSEALSFYIVRTSEVYRMWVIPQDGFEQPIVITAIATEGNDSFLDTAADVVSTISFGDPQPHPVAVPEGPLWEAGLASTVPAGVQMVPALGGLQFEMEEDRFVFQDQQFLVFETTEPTDSPVQPSMIVAGVFQDQGGEPIIDRQQLLAVLAEHGQVQLSGDTLEALDQELIGYDFVGDVAASGAAQPAFSSAGPASSSNLAWLPADRARLYLGDLEEGVLVIGYQGVTEFDQRLGQAVFDEVAPTLSLAASASNRPIPPNAR